MGEIWEMRAYGNVQRARAMVSATRAREQRVKVWLRVLTFVLKVTPTNTTAGTLIQTLSNCHRGKSAEKLIQRVESILFKST